MMHEQIPAVREFASAECILCKRLSGVDSLERTSGSTLPYYSTVAWASARHHLYILEVFMLIGMLRKGEWFRCPRLRVEGYVTQQSTVRTIVRLRCLSKFPEQPDIPPGRFVPRISVKKSWDVEPMSGRAAQPSPVKLSEPDVIQIRDSHESNRALASLFSVSPSTISRVRKRQIWRWL